MKEQTVDGKRVKAIRMKAGYDRADLAGICGVDLRRVQVWEQGRMPLMAYKLMLIFLALGKLEATTELRNTAVTLFLQELKSDLKRKI